MPTLSPSNFGKIKETKQQIRTIQSQARALIQKVDTEKREMSAEEKSQLDKCTSDILALDERVTTLEQYEDTESDDDEPADDDVEPADDDEPADDEGERGNIGNNGQRRANDSRREQRSRANPQRGARRVSNLDNPEEGRYTRHKARRSSKQYRQAVLNYMQYGQSALMNAIQSRALQADVDIQGGYLVLPEEMGESIWKKADDALVISKLISNMTLANAASLGSPTLESDPDDADWTTEIATISADSSMKFGKRLITPHPLRKRLLVSERFLRMAMTGAFKSRDDADGVGGGPKMLVENRMIRKVAVPKESAIMTGSGVNQHLGLFTASTRGISTSRDVQTGSSTNLTYAGLLAAKYALKVQYHPYANWLFSRAAMQKIMGLVDSNGRPLIDFGTLPNQPKTLLEVPVQLSEFCPNTFTTGQYVGMIADFSYYMFVNGVEVGIKMADQLYAETGQIGFFVNAEADGMPIFEEAFARLITN